MVSDSSTSLKYVMFWFSILFYLKALMNYRLQRIKTNITHHTRGNHRLWLH